MINQIKMGVAIPQDQVIGRSMLIVVLALYLFIMFSPYYFDKKFANEKIVNEYSGICEIKN